MSEQANEKKAVERPSKDRSFAARGAAEPMRGAGRSSPRTAGEQLPGGSDLRPRSVDPEMSEAAKRRAARQPRGAGGKFASTISAQEQRIIDLEREVARLKDDLQSAEALEQAVLGHNRYLHDCLAHVRTVLGVADPYAVASADDWGSNFREAYQRSAQADYAAVVKVKEEPAEALLVAKSQVNTLSQTVDQLRASLRRERWLWVFFFLLALVSSTVSVGLLIYISRLGGPR